jgi:excisionase family DNA binding protein
MAQMQELQTSPPGLSASQAARALGVSIGTIRRWTDLGHLRSYLTPGGQRRFSETGIREFIDALQARTQTAAVPRDELQAVVADDARPTALGSEELCVASI